MGRIEVSLSQLTRRFSARICLERFVAEDDPVICQSAVLDVNKHPHGEDQASLRHLSPSTGRCKRQQGVWNDLVGGSTTDLSPDSPDKVPNRGDLSMARRTREGHETRAKGLNIPLSETCPQLLNGTKEKAEGRKPRKRKAKTETNGTTK